MELSLEGKRALVGGSSRGIGRAVAEELASLGASVTVMARTKSALDEVVAGMNTASGQSHHSIIADMTDHDGVISSVEKHVEEHGAFHIMVNNTGGPPGGLLVDSDMASLVQAFHDHVLMSHLLMKVVVHNMKTTGYGRFINIISTSVKQPIPGLGVSNTIRGAMASWAKTLATELGSFGITVNNVLPGATATERLSSIIDRKVASTGKDEAAVRESLLAEIPVGRFGEPGEIANAVAFLASPAASYINGTSVLVDGGRTQSLS